MVWRRRPKRPMGNDMERWLSLIRRFSVECGSKALRLETLEAYRQKLGCHVVYMSNPELRWPFTSMYWRAVRLLFAVWFQQTTTTVPLKVMCFALTDTRNNRLVKIAVIHVESQAPQH
ncbi:hypothetical protein BDZ85DRAFT_265864 [Elsinoe ampelina]|uniref:Uncharacterized protein n=1 Tax=Elsinoe ampelina TaxID=302913 RepID=A0A6A6G4Z7_9PEZI|nr:hypothetical protein BDZ85DRAFT_265864 [Elsinoe ampelina]